MLNSYKKIYPFYVIVDVILIAICFFISYFLRYRTKILESSYFPFLREYIYITILWTIFIINTFRRRNLYTTDRTLTIPKEISKVAVALFYVSILMATIIFFAKYKFFSRQIFIRNLFLLWFFLSSWRVIKRLIVRKLIVDGFHNFNVLIIGAGDIGKFAFEEIKTNPQWGFKVIGFLDNEIEESKEDIRILGKLKDLVVVAKKYFIDELIITISSDKANIIELMKQARKLSLGVRVVAENFEEPALFLNISYLGVLPLITYKERRPHPTELFLKRLFDFVFALFSIILLFPFFIIIALFIRLNSKGPIFYIQKRVGFKGKIFNLYKFRSMRKDADRLKPELLTKNEVRDGVIFKIRKDPRITHIGTFLRKYSLDELPQLFNVLKGEMSLVGPRPPTPEEVEKYNYFHMDRLSIRPGITGLSQIKGRSELTFRKWVRWDLWYVNHWSFILDLKILWLTVPAVFKGEGAY